MLTLLVDEYRTHLINDIEQLKKLTATEGARCLSSLEGSRSRILGLLELPPRATTPQCIRIRMVHILERTKKAYLDAQPPPPQATESCTEKEARVAAGRIMKMQQGRMNSRRSGVRILDAPSSSNVVD